MVKGVEPNNPQPAPAIKTAEVKVPVLTEVFKVLDPQGYTVILDSERWEHIMKGHPEMATLLEKLQETVANPEIIQRDAKRSETHYYYRLSGRSFARSKDLYVNAVVARHEPSKTGRVKTAFLVPTIRKHGEDYVWLNRI
jgi:hypothetical protein